MRGSSRTGWVVEIIWVNDRVVHWVGGVDVDSTVAVRMLESRSDANIAVAIAVHVQELDLPNRAVENGRGGRIADCRVPVNNSIVVSCIWFVQTNLTKNRCLNLIDPTAIHSGSVHVSNGGIDVGKEKGVAL